MTIPECTCDCYPDPIGRDRYCLVHTTPMNISIEAIEQAVKQAAEAGAFGRAERDG